MSYVRINPNLLYQPIKCFFDLVGSCFTNRPNWNMQWILQCLLILINVDIKIKEHYELKLSFGYKPIYMDFTIHDISTYMSFYAKSFLQVDSISHDISTNGLHQLISSQQKINHLGKLIPKSTTSTSNGKC